MALTDSGLTVLRTADYIARIQAEYIAEAGLPEDTVFTGDALLDVFVGIVAAELDSLGQLAVGIYDSFSEANANGAQLDNINGLRGVRRKAGTQSRVPATFTGTVGAAIGSGVEIQGGGTDGSARWTSLEDVTIGAGGTATVTLQAVDRGPISVNAGSASIVTPRAGLTSAAFGSPVSLGTAAEDDAAARLRGALSTSAAGAHTVGALLAAVLAVPAVTDATVIDNPDNVPRTVEGVALGAHRYIIYVLPNPVDSGTQTAVLNAIAGNVHIGVATDATAVTRVETDAATGASLTIGFDYGSLLTVPVRATVTLAPGFSVTDAGAALSAAIATHVATLNMGDALTRLDLCRLAAGIESITAADFLLNLVDADFQPLANQKINNTTLFTLAVL